jgi:DNA mismatch repair ATPase MutL
MMMRASRFLHVSTFCILVVGSVALYAQDDKRQPERPQRQEEPRPEANQGQMNQPRHEEARPGNQEKQEQKAEKQQEQRQEKQNQERQDQQRQSEDQQKHAREQMKDDHQNQMSRAQEEHGRPRGKSAHIPEERFRSNFGRSHTFAVRRPVIVQGQPGFVYGGYSFVFVDPWPADWAYSDDCYVDYIDDEYFLFDALHPGVRIALFVVI